MSQEGNILSLQPPSSASSPHHFANSPHTMQSPAVVDHHSSDEEKGGGSGKGPGGKSRRELPAGAVATLKAWLLSPEHFTHPYPTPQDQIMLMHKTGIDKKQLKNWFTNARRRIWKPMLKKQLEAGKLAAAGGAVVGSSAGGVALAPVPGGGPGITVMGVPQPELSSSLPPLPTQQAPQQEMFSNFQQAQSNQYEQPGGGDPNQQQYQQPQQQQYQQQQQQVQFGQDTGQPVQQPMYDQYGNQIFQDPNQQYQYQQQGDPNQQPQQQPPPNNQSQFPISNSIGSLAPMNPTSSVASMGSFGKMFKTDSHAVLMELFARDQDLVRQAAGKGGAQVQQSAQGGQPQAGATNSLQASGQSGNLRWANGTASPSMGQKQKSSVTFEGVPSLASWPHFSSVSSLNNLGGLQGVKSITNLSAADLSSQGNLNRMGNLAQVKSIENMGRGDSFAFLEVFFDDKSGLTSSNNSATGQRGVKREREEDDGAIGLSLDGDDGASPASPGQQQAPPPQPAVEPGVPTPAPLPEDGQDTEEGGDGEGGTLKRAYDDALAARGLIAVRRSCEKLTDLALPAKMQRTLSQEYIRQHNQGQPMGDFFSTANSAYAPNSNSNIANMQQQQYPPQQQPPGESVAVPMTAKCALCGTLNVDTQLRPCGHMYHGRCLKPSLQNTGMPPQCPICSTSMQSAILAVPSGPGAADGSAPAAAMGATAADGVASNNTVSSAGVAGGGA